MRLPYGQRTGPLRSRPRTGTGSPIVDNSGCIPYKNDRLIDRVAHRNSEVLTEVLAVVLDYSRIESFAKLEVVLCLQNLVDFSVHRQTAFGYSVRRPARGRNGFLASTPPNPSILTR